MGLSEPCIKELVDTSSGRDAIATTDPHRNASPNLDLLRSIAVLIVLIQHILLTIHIRQVGAWNIENLGRIGVYMFFVHTSLVLMWSLGRRPDSIDFYIRRVFRIYPIAIVCILLTILFHIPTKHNAAGDIFYYVPSATNLVSNLLLIQNLVWHGSILGVTWTLPLEIDMYLFLPFLHTITLGKAAFSRVILIWFGAVVFGLLVLEPRADSFIACIPVFLAGVLASTLFTRVRPRLSGYFLPLLLFGIVCGCMKSPTWAVAWGLFLVLGLTLPFFRSITAKWLIQLSHQIAKYSYGIYLIHPFCIVIGFVLLREYSFGIRLLGTVVSLVLFVVPAYHFLEKPMIDLGAQLASRLRHTQNPSHQ